MGQQAAFHSLIRDYQFLIMVTSTTIIAASGYFINDYYDIKIDLINKPSKVIVGKDFKRRPVMFAHAILNTIGILMGLYVSIWIGLINSFAVFLLWLYSNQLKRMPFIGNFIVAVLTAATLMTLSIYFRDKSLILTTYAVFAFGINLIREIIKDIEDVQGDASFGSKSLPIILGVRTTKQIVMVFTILFICSLVLFLIEIQNTLLTTYFIVLFIPFSHFTFLLAKADKKKDFTLLSKYCKWIILAGILSMVVFRI